MYLRQAEVTVDDLADALGIGRYSVMNKLARHRRWTLDDVPGLLALLSKRLARRVTFQEVFCTSVRSRRRKRRATEE